MQTIETTGVDVTRDTDNGSGGITLRRNQRMDWADLGASPRTFDEAARIAVIASENDGRRMDVQGVALDACQVTECPTTGALALQYGNNVLALRDNAYSQLCSQVGAPSWYLRDNLSAGLAIDCLRTGIRERGNKTVTLRAVDCRERGGTTEVRALVGPRYTNMDDPIAFPLLRGELDRQGLLGNLRVRALGVGAITVLRMTLKDMEMPDGHPISIGLDFRNGELGNSSLSIMSSIYRLVCTNGMCAWTKGQRTAWRHVGQVKALTEKFEKSLPVTIDHSRKVAALCAETTNRVMSAEEVREAFAKLDLSKAQQEEAERLAGIEAGLLPPGAQGGLPDDSRLSLWDAINGVTASARPLAHGARLETEEKASQLLALV